MRLNAVKLGLAGGIFWGVVLFVMSWVSMLTNYAVFWLNHWMDVYPGFDLTVAGSIFGLIYGFLGGFLALFLIGWIYNLLKP